MTALAADYTHYFWQGERTRLRPLRLDDAELRFIASLDTPTRQLHQDGVELPSSVELQREWLARAIASTDSGTIRLMIDNLDGATVGWTTLHSGDQKNGTFSFGVAVYPDYRGQGCALDAVRTLLKYGFWEQRYQKCNSACIASNAASIRLHEKLGFVEEGRIRRNSFCNGAYHDELLFGLTCEEFNARMHGAA